jgi:anthranilate phosphoribosyltransferase
LLVADEVETLAEGIEKAAIAIDSGAARRALDKLIEITNA